LKAITTNELDSDNAGHSLHTGAKIMEQKVGTWPHLFLHLKQQEDGDKFQDNMELEAKATIDQHVSPSGWGERGERATRVCGHAMLDIKIL
jgi:hypothetical protein